MSRVTTHTHIICRPCYITGYLLKSKTRLGSFRSPLDPALGSRPDLPPASRGRYHPVRLNARCFCQCPTIRRSARSRKVGSQTEVHNTTRNYIYFITNNSIVYTTTLFNSVTRLQSQLKGRLKGRDNNKEDNRIKKKRRDFRRMITLQKKRLDFRIRNSNLKE